MPVPGADAWSAWRWMCVRGAGFPAALVLDLVQPESAAAVDALLEAGNPPGAPAQACEDARQSPAWRSAVRTIEAELSSAVGPRRTALRQLLKRLRQGRLPELALGEPAVDELLAGLHPLLGPAEERRLAARRVFERERLRVSEHLRAVATLDAFREAVAWQNRQSVATMLDPLRERPVGAADHSTRRKEALVARYLQRYCAKNDTIGFFGPVGWGALRAGTGLELRPGPRLLASRTVYFEHWAIEGLARTLGQQPELHKRLGIYGAGPWLSEIELWKSLYLGYGQWAFSTDGKSLGYTDDSKFVDYLNMLIRLQDSGAVLSQQEEIARYRRAGVESRPIVTGKSAMESIWSNQLVALWTAAGESRTFKLNPLPRPKGGQPESYVHPSMFIAITSHSKHPKEAAIFIDFMTNDEEANKILLAERGVPISPKIQAAIAPLLTPPQVETQNYLALIETDSSPLPPPDPVSQTKLNDNLYVPQLIDPVLLKQTSPEDAMARFRKDATALLQS